ncbi:biotin synthase BioB [Parvularcula dongshanensis]|uniref:Biotin synthase n=1 Tax=Parvularcula dongshanensis TaxID=1173995 RepID=A0A840I3Y4_9PROT|nr:biotin synthase BioB [Parvularcula dongshanensis]MBB4659045.1 biotin synthase [Parvularcula dongshanensis]
MYDSAPAAVRTDWTKAEVRALMDLPFMELVFRAAEVHRANFDPSELQMSQLLSIKTGGCAEDCGYCSQSAHWETGLKASKLMPREEVAKKARAAKASGAQRYCMGAAWRELKDRDLPAICGMIADVKAMGLETCMTLGMLTDAQAEALSEAGLDYYNHNIDTSPAFYGEVVTTRTFEDRLATLGRVRSAGIQVCSGGILGMGEGREDRAGMIHALCTLEEHPGSVPINALIPVEGTPLEGRRRIDPFEFVRTVATARITMPRSVVRLSAGRDEMTDECQALCFLAGANSVFVGEVLLTKDNPEPSADARLFERLDLRPSSR